MTGICLYIRGILRLSYRPAGRGDYIGECIKETMIPSPPHYRTLLEYIKETFFK